MNHPGYARILHLLYSFTITGSNGTYFIIITEALSLTLSVYGTGVWKSLATFSRNVGLGLEYLHEIHVTHGMFPICFLGDATDTHVSFALLSLDTLQGGSIISVARCPDSLPKRLVKEDKRNIFITQSRYDRIAQIMWSSSPTIDHKK